MVHVRDSGRGIRKQDLLRLFSRFGKLDDPENINEEGIGLGLTICQAIIKANDGLIQITSDGIGKGTLVVFTMKMSSVASDELSRHSDRMTSEENGHAGKINQTLTSSPLPQNR